MAKNKKEDDAELELRLETVGGSTVISCALPNGQTFTKTVDGDLDEMPEEEQKRILTQAYVEAGAANSAFKATESFASIVGKALRDNGISIEDDIDDDGEVEEEKG
jgi:hypothetical protein